MVGCRAWTLNVACRLTVADQGIRKGVSRVGWGWVVVVVVVVGIGGCPSNS